MVKVRKNLVGMRFGKLKVVEQVEDYTLKTGANYAKWLCKCDCGNKKKIMGHSLKRGDTKSCGCLQSELFKKMTTVHSLVSNPLYKVWQGMKERCYNANTLFYKDYGGRGITVCGEWIADPRAFIEWGFASNYKKGLQIDRINNDGSYNPNNCHFVTAQENAVNRRKPSNNTSGYVGISLHKRSNKWMTKLVNKNKIHYLGSYRNKKEALKMRNDFIKINKLNSKIQEWKG